MSNFYATDGDSIFHVVDGPVPDERVFELLKASGLPLIGVSHSTASVMNIPGLDPTDLLPSQVTATLNNLAKQTAELARLRAENERLRAENDELRIRRVEPWPAVRKSTPCCSDPGDECDRGL